jgi:hypothetical protein
VRPKKCVIKFRIGHIHAGTLEGVKFRIIQVGKKWL